MEDELRWCRGSSKEFDFLVNRIVLINQDPPGEA